MPSIQSKIFAAVFVTLLTVLASCTSPPLNTSTDDGVVVRKSPNDDRDYRYLTLDNELRVLLVSDPTTEKSAAALSVYRGSFHEPEDHPGLAHFLEHMLFIQTQTYPEIDGFATYVSANGGNRNAYTALDHTNYFFDIRNEAFPEGLRRFAHFFIDPVLSPEYSAREKNAVHSEYQLQLKDDGWRGYMTAKQSLNPEHPGSNFTIGSLDTLAGDIHEDLREFFEREYSADQMGLVIVSPQGLDEMAEWIVPVFAKIPNNDIGPDHPDMPLYAQGDLPATLKIKALKEGTTVTYAFPLPSTREHYKTKPEFYFTNLIGHEGAGSLHAYLKAKGWIESLGSGVTAFDRRTSILNVAIELTPAGQDNVEAVTDALLRYIELIRSQPPQAWLYEEQAKVAELGFRFQEKSSPLSLAYQMAPRLDQVPAADLLVAPFLMERFDPELIGEYMGYLTPENLIVEYVSDTVVGDQEEPWFGVEYSLEHGPAARTKTSVADLRLPDPNPFLPDDLDLLSADDSGLVPAIERPGFTLWADTDVEYGTPRANLYLTLAVAGGLESPQDRAYAQLYRMLVQDALNEFVYPAYLAGMGYSVTVSDPGFDVRLSGYQDKHLALLTPVLETLVTAPLPQDRFDILKASLVRDWRNVEQERPLTQVNSALSDALRSGRWPRDLLIEAIADATPERLTAWREAHFESFHVLGMAHGNIDAAYIAVLDELLDDQLTLADHTLEYADVKDIDAALRLELPVDHQDAAMVLHVQDQDDSIASRARSSLAAQLLHSAYFLQLRTEQQLGYVVAVSNRPIVKRAGISFLIQSPVVSSAELERRTTTFLDEFIESWADMEVAEFEQQKAGLINKLTQKPKNLSERSGIYWQDLVDEVLTFDSREQVAAEVESLTPDDMRAFLERLQAKLSGERFLIYTRGKFDETPDRGKLLSTAIDEWDTPQGDS